MDWANHIPPEGNAWRNYTAVRDFLVRDLTFPPITSLFLEWVDWRTLSPTALTSLHGSYKFVKELELRWIAFTVHELCNLIAALTTLEKITVGEGAPFDQDPWTVDSVQMTHPSLCKLAFSYPPPSWMIQFFARAIRYTTGIVEVSISIYLLRHQFKVCGELLEAAGTSLRAFKFRDSVFTPPFFVGDAIPFAELLSFPRNTNLQEIELKTVYGSTLKRFMQGLRLNAKPNLRQLKLVLEHRDYLEEWAGNWGLADEVLSTMSLKDPKLILELPSLRGEPYNAQASENADPQELLKTLKSLLPRTAECWKLEVEFRQS